MNAVIEAKSERVTLLVSPLAKKRFRAKAKSLGVSTSELLRLAVDAYGNPAQERAQEEELLALTRELRAALPGMHADLDQANSAVERALANIEARRSKVA